MRYKNILPVAFVMLSFIACKKETNNTDASGRPEFAYNVKVSSILDMVNQVRQSGCQCGPESMPPVSPLAWNDLLGKAAYDHSKDMQENSYFDHKGQNGSTAGSRIKLAGYQWTAAGENIAWGQTTEQHVFNSWINSSGHCKNIMSKHFKEMGIGRSGNYWTQTFGARAN